MSTLLPYPRFKAVNSLGIPYSGGKVYTYEAGTDTAKYSYSDRACSVAHTNPVILDANGEATIYLDGSYKLVLKDSSGNLVWTLDYIQGMVRDDITGSTLTITGDISCNDITATGTISGVIQGTEYINSDVNNVSFGLNSMGSPTGTRNTAVGEAALGSMTSGYRNTALGWSAGTAITTASGNVALGDGALMTNVDGIENIAIGYGSMGNETSTKWNIAIGTGTMQDLTTGYQNIAIGDNCLNNCLLGKYNIAIGVDAMLGGVTGESNTALGQDSGASLVGGNNNLFLGYRAGYSSCPATINESTAIGYLAEATASNVIVLGNLGQDTVSLPGRTQPKVGIGISNPTVLLHMHEHTMLTGNVVESYCSTIALGPQYDGAFTVTRHMYFYIATPDLDNGAAVTDSFLFQFDAAPGTHKAVDAASTKTTPTDVKGWIKVNISGTTYYIPMYTSKTD